MDNEEGTGLAVVCRWTAEEFGETNDTSKDIRQHWFVLYVLDEEEMENPQEMLEFCQENCSLPVSLELVDYYLLNGHEMVGICKTFWLKMIQRKWRKTFAKRKEILKERQKIKSITHRQRHGCWPTHLKEMPSLVGMLA